MPLRDRLAALVQSAPPDATVPVRWLGELLAAEPCDRPGDEPTAPALSGVDFTIAHVAQQLGKGPSTVRTWCLRGELPGAYRLHGREWRIPASAVAALQRAQAAAHRAGRVSTAAIRDEGTTDLAAWRRHVPTSRPA